MSLYDPVTLCELIVKRLSQQAFDFSALEGHRDA